MSVSTAAVNASGVTQHQERSRKADRLSDAIQHQERSGQIDRGAGIKRVVRPVKIGQRL